MEPLEHPVMREIAGGAAVATPVRRRFAIRWTSPTLALIKRDLVALLRQQRAYYLLVGIVGTCLIIVSAMWPWEDVSRLTVGRVSREMFGFFAWVHLIAACSLPPGLAALAFSEDRRQDTLDQLRLSLVSSRGLVASKLISAVALVLLVFIATLPALGVQLFLVGVSQAEILGITAVILANALVGAAIGLWSAARFRRPLLALVVAYLGAAFVFGGWIPVVIALMAVLSIPFNGSPDIDYFLGPGAAGEAFESLLQYLAESTFDVYVRLGRMAGGWGQSIVQAVIYRGAWAVVCILGAALALRRAGEPAPVPRARPIDDPEALRRRRQTFPFYLIDPLRRRPPIPDGANPVFMRELRHGLGVRVHSAIRIFLATTILAGGLGMFFTWPTGNTYRLVEGIAVLMLWETGLAILIVLVLVAGVLARERELQSLELLWMSLLTPAEVLQGKLQAALGVLAPFLIGVAVGSIPPLALLAMGTGEGILTLLAGYLTLFTCAWFSLALALLAGVGARSTASALITSVVLSAAVFIGPFVAALVTDSLLHWLYLVPRQSPSSMAFFMYFSPPYMYVRFREESPYFGSLDPASGRFLLLVLLLFVGAGFGVLKLARLRLVASLRRERL